VTYRKALAAGFGCVLLAGGVARAEGGLKMVAAADAAQPVAFDVLLPLRDTDKLEALLKDLHDPNSASYHHWLTPQQFGMRFGPDSGTVARVSARLRAMGFTVQAQTRSLHVTGTAALVQQAFAAPLMVAANAEGRRRVVAMGKLRMPDVLAEAGARIYSFSPHEAHTHATVVRQLSGTDNRYGPTGGYWFDDLRQAYSFPSYTAQVTVGGNTQRLDGTGATIGVLMSSDVLDSDVQAMFDHEQWSAITGQPAPKLYQRVPVNGGAPFTLGSGVSFEASLDVQQELTGAPGAHVVLYNIPDLSDGNVFAGYITVVEQNQVDLVSSSFGGCELQYFPKYNHGTDFRGVLQSLHELFMQGNAQGITFLASSGDNAGKECPQPDYFYGVSGGHFVAGVSEPADDPNVTAVGGTNLVTGYLQGSLTSPYVGENAWGDPELPNDPYGLGLDVSGGWWGAGGGASAMWAQPSYQALLQTGSAMRTLPDIGMQVGGCPGGIAKLDHGTCDGGNKPYNGNGNSQRSYVVTAMGVGMGGGFYGLIGTSVASPELAGAVALLIEERGRMGNLNEFIYRAAARQAAGAPRMLFHTGIPGYNGVQQTLINPAYSYSTGVGTPVVATLLGAQLPVAGDPQTPSNP